MITSKTAPIGANAPAGVIQVAGAFPAPQTPASTDALTRTTADLLYVHLGTVYGISDIAGLTAALAGKMSLVVGQGYTSLLAQTGLQPVAMARTIALSSPATYQRSWLHLEIPTSASVVSLQIVDRYTSTPTVLATIPLNVAGDKATLELVHIMHHQIVSSNRSITHSIGYSILDSSGARMDRFSPEASGSNWILSSGDIAYLLTTPSASAIPVSVMSAAMEEQ
jgi:hypothetical protein